MIHHYTASVLDRTGTYRDCIGAGRKPTPKFLADRGWHEVADRPEPPAPTGWTWQAADPAYALVDGVSVPQGEWVAVPLAELQAAALARFHAEAGMTIDENLPQPWDRLRDVATLEFREWADAYLAEVAGELARLEAAVTAAATAADLDEISAAWPEVTT